MVLRGTYYQRKATPPPAPPPVVHDAPTQPSLRRPAPFAVMLARVLFAFRTASPKEQVAWLGVASIWFLVLLGLLLIAGIWSYDMFLANKDLSPAKQVILDPQSFTPLVHIGIEPLFSATPATPAPQPRATPAAARRPPVIIVVPTPAK
jgi:hypothetical protein